MTDKDLRTYEIPCFPDLSLPKYINLLGEQALPVAASRLVGWIRLLSSATSSFSFTLRYKYNPNPENGQKNRRLKLQILLKQNENSGTQNEELGESMVRAVLQLESIPQSSVRLGDEYSKHLAILSRKESFINESGLLHYKPERWLRSSRSRQALEPFLDEAFDAFKVPAFLDIRLRPLDTMYLNSALRAAINDLESDGKIGKAYFSESARDVYKHCLDDISSSPVCEAVICAGAADKETAHRLLQIFAIETTGSTDSDILSVKNAEIRNKLIMSGFSGDFFQPLVNERNWYSKDLEEECIRNGNHHSERYKVLSQLQVVAGADLIEDLLTLPIPRQGYLRTFPLETELHSNRHSQEIVAESSPNFIVFGQDLERYTSAQILTKHLNKHAFVAGVTGSGKTVTMFNILRQLGEQEIPFFVFEPAKTEYRGLLRLNKYFHDNLRVYTPGREQLNPIRLNPFEFGGSITLGEHVANLMSAFRAALPMWEPMPSVLEEAIWNLYEQRGWTEADEGSAGYQFPIISDILSAIEIVMDKLNYDPENNSRIRGAFRSRLVRLTRGSIGSLFNAQRTTPQPIELFKYPTVLELHTLSQEQVNLATMFILILIREYLKDDKQRQDLKLVLVLEEAHNLVPNSSGKSGGGEEVDLRAEAARYITNMLAEMRALGLSIIVVDQTPSAVSPFVLKNTNLKLAHRTVAKDDRETLAHGMLMNGSQEELLGRLLPGEVFLYSEQYYRPILVANAYPKAIKLNDSDDVSFPLSDSSLISWLVEHKWYVQTFEDRLNKLSKDVLKYVGVAVENRTHFDHYTQSFSIKNVDDEDFSETKEILKDEYSKLNTELEDICRQVKNEFLAIQFIHRKITEGGRKITKKEEKRDVVWSNMLADIKFNLNELVTIKNKLLEQYDQLAI